MDIDSIRGGNRPNENRRWSPRIVLGVEKFKERGSFLFVQGCEELSHGTGRTTYRAADIREGLFELRHMASI